MPSFIERNMDRKHDGPPRARLLLAPLLVLACAAGCKGVGGAGDGWPGDEGWVGAGAPSTVEWTPTPTNPRISDDASPVGAILSRLLPGDGERDNDRARRVRFEPVPIVGEREIGMSFTVRW